MRWLRWLGRWYGCVTLTCGVVSLLAAVWATGRWDVGAVLLAFLAGAAFVWVSEWWIDRPK